MKTFLKNNGLSLSFSCCFYFPLLAFGLQEHNKEFTQEAGAAVTLGAYLLSGHFLQSTFENWESEFLQMALFVVLTIFLQRKGSWESKTSTR